LKKIYSIPEFARYIKIADLKNENLHIARFDAQSDTLYKSGPVSIDFYFLSIKTLTDNNIISPFQQSEKSNAYLFLDCPHNSLEWDLKPPVTGYSVLVSAKLLNAYAKGYNFMHYDRHEALFLTKDEEIILWDLFQKAYNEFQKDQFSKEVVISYIALILSYTQLYYNRQFDSRGKIYHQLIANFHKNLDEYFTDQQEIPGLPSVAYFAQKANLSPNYFGDLVKHFTGESPIEHIHNYIIASAKEKLQTTNLSISEISYSLGFDYPTYFTRFFRKMTGISPRLFRNQ
jgi:AraC-like DNA-binding protein